MFVKAMGVWLVGMFLEIAKMPFSRNGGRIAGSLENMSEGLQMDRQPIVTFPIKGAVESFEKAASVWM